jgi:hypothetical protein
MNTEETMNPDEVLATLRAEAKLDGQINSLDRVGRAYRDKVKANVFETLDANIAQAWDAIDLLPDTGRGWQNTCVILECCTGSNPYIKGFLLPQKIPAFELRPAAVKKTSLSSIVATQAFSDAVAQIPEGWWGSHPKKLHPETPLSFYLMERNTVTFTKQA